ncbi:MAG: rhodanese-like domain-containing protein [Actinomycetota bacterium]|nr:rhodanese-like domain-containing protein [Actinomycetota bacterium]
MPRAIERDELEELLDEDAQLVEVLPEKAYEQAHLPGAINIPLKSFSADTLEQLDRERPVVVYCSGYL